MASGSWTEIWKHYGRLASQGKLGGHLFKQRSHSQNGNCKRKCCTDIQEWKGEKVEKNSLHKNNASQLMRFVILMKGGGYYMLLHSTSVFPFVKISYSFFPIHNDPIASDSAKQETKGTEWIFYSNYKKCNCLQRPARCSWGKAIFVTNLWINKCFEEKLEVARASAEKGNSVCLNIQSNLVRIFFIFSFMYRHPGLVLMQNC